MNATKHVAGFALFSFILGSAILINHFLSFPRAVLRPVVRPKPVPAKVKEQPVTFRVRQVSLDYINKRSYTELNLFQEPGQPMPEKVWVLTTFYSPDSVRAEDWTTIEEIHSPFDRGDGGRFVVVTSNSLPPLLSKTGAGYFARVEVSSQAEGKFYPPDYHYSSDPANALPVVIHWPDKKGVTSVAAEKVIR
jgi:hypothetical protein